MDQAITLIPQLLTLVIRSSARWVEHSESTGQEGRGS